MSRKTSKKNCLPPVPPDFSWEDAAWLRFRRRTERPRLLYHLRLHAWRRSGTGDALSCETLTDWLIPYLKELGCTGAVLVTDDTPLSAFPAAAGTQASADTPRDWMTLVDRLHRAGLSVFLDWHPGELDSWQLPAVRRALCANARLWLEGYHLDGLRADVPDPARYLAGSGCLALLTDLEQTLAQHCPDAALLLRSPMPVSGFSGWQERNTQPLLDLFQGGVQTLDNALTEGGILSLPVPPLGVSAPSYRDCLSGSADAARACYLAFLALPGGKLVAMGTELGQRGRLSSEISLDWHLLERPEGTQYHAFFQAANGLYLSRPVLWSEGPGSFQWLRNSCENPSVLVFLRRSDAGELLCLCNPTDAPVTCTLPEGWDETTCQLLLSSDERRFGGGEGCRLRPPAESEGTRWRMLLPPVTCALLDHTPSSDGLHLR